MVWVNFMKKLFSIKGFTLIELIITITLIGIISVPIVEGIIGALKTNAESKRKADATILAGKIAEVIEISNLEDLDGNGTKEIVSDLNDDGTKENLSQNGSVDVSFNNSIYRVSWELKAQDNPETGSYVMAGYKKYYLIELNGSTISVTKYNEDGTTQLVTSGITYNNNECSLIFRGQMIYIYNYKILGSQLGQVTCPETVTDVRVSNTSGNIQRLALYNNNTDNTVVNVFYNSSELLYLDIKYDRNIALRDLKEILSNGGLDLNKKISKTVYTIRIKYKDSDPKPLIERDVVRISAAN